MNVPILDLRAQYAEVRAEVDAAILEVCAAQRFILGEKVDALERQIAEYSRARFGVGVSSGTDALLCALMALKVGPGDEVVVPAFSFFATAGAVARLGARPVFVDIDPRTFNADPRLVADALTPKTKAVIPVDLYGQMAEMGEIRRLAHRRGAAVIEDAAQAIGAEHHGRRAGQCAAMTCLSFFPTKNLGGFGDGGMILTDDERLATRCRTLRVHGGEREYFHAEVGGNFRLDAIQAAVLAVKLGHLERWTEARRRRAARYDELLAVGDVTTPFIHPYNRCVYHQYTIRVPAGRRDAMQEHLARRGIAARVYYPVPLPLQECFASLGHRPGDFPEAERAAAEVLSLPVYPEMTDEMTTYVADAVKSVARDDAKAPG